MIESIPSVFIVDDHQIVIDPIRVELSRFGSSIRYAGSALNGKDAISALQNDTIDVLILDISLPDMDGLEILKYINLNHPNTKVLVFTMYDDLAHISAMLQNGAKGYILKNNGAKYVVDAVTNILAGNDYFPPEIAQKALKGVQSKYFAVNATSIEKLIKSITPIEAELLGFLSLGLSGKEIADKMSVAAKTIESRQKNLRDKIGVNSVLGLVRFAVENGFSIDKE